MDECLYPSRVVRLGEVSYVNLIGTTSLFVHEKSILHFKTLQP